MPRLRASADTRRISSKSKASPCSRRTGDSIAMTPTSAGTRPDAVRVERALDLLPREGGLPGRERQRA